MRIGPRGSSPIINIIRLCRSLPSLRILFRRPPNLLADLRVLHAPLPRVLPDHLDQKLPVVAVVEQKRHLVANLWEGLVDARALNAAGVARVSNIIHVGEQLVSDWRAEDAPFQQAVEPERVIEIEAVCRNDRGSEIVELLVARNFDVPIELRIKGHAKHKGTGICHWTAPACAWRLRLPTPPQPLDGRHGAGTVLHPHSPWFRVCRDPAGPGSTRARGCHSDSHG